MAQEIPPGYWNAHSDRDWEDECGMHEEWPDYAEVAETKIAHQAEEINDLKATIAQLSADLQEATKWARAYEEAHGLFKAMPPLPAFMITF